MRTRIGLFLALLAFWLVLTDQYQPLYLSLGVLSAAGVAWLLGDFFGQALGAPQPLARLPLRLWRLLVFAVWLLGRMLKSSIEVAVVVLDPRLPTEPGFVRFRTGLRSPLARSTLANAITLVPGTLTVRVRGDELLIHALWPAAADDVRTGELQRRIAALFLEEPDPQPVETTWEPAEEER